MANSAERLPDPMTGDEFVRWMDTWIDERWELFEGHPYMMSGGSTGHSTIAGNIDNALRPLRKRGCRPQRDLLLRSPVNDGFGAFPDVFVRCGPIDDRKTWHNDPVAVFEVLSSSTMRVDRGYKSEQYEQFPTMRHICLVHQNEVRIEMWTRGDDGEWIREPEVLQGLDKTLNLTAFELSIPLAEIYADTELAAA